MFLAIDDYIELPPHELANLQWLLGILIEYPESVDSTLNDSHDCIPDIIWQFLYHLSDGD